MDKYTNRMRLTPELVQEIKPLLEDAAFGPDAPKLVLGQVRHCEYDPGQQPVGKDDYEIVFRSLSKPMADDIMDVLLGTAKVVRPKQPKKERVKKMKLSAVMRS